MDNNYPNTNPLQPMMKQLFSRLLLMRPLCRVCMPVFLLMFLWAGNVMGQVSVTGALTGNGNYTTLGAAISAIGTSQSGANIVVSITANTTESTSTISIGAGTWASLTIRPSGGSWTISAATTAGSPMIDFSGADNVTINGLNTGGNALTIENTTVSSTSGTSTIRFIGGATGNTITNCTIRGAGSMSVATNGATIFFSTDGVTTNGNDNNTISNNNIGPSGSNLPTKAIYGNGSTTTTAIGNSGILIDNNNIFDYFGAAVTSSGIATNNGCNTWTITNNRFYQTGTRTWTTGATHRAIDLNTSSGTSGAQGMTVTGNVIGYASSSQTGTYTLTGSTGKFQGIYFNGITLGTVSNINSNTIASVSLSGVTSSGTGSSSPFAGIIVNNGVANTNSNSIGSQSSTGSLTFSTNSTNATDIYGLYNVGFDSWTANSNNIGGISATNSAASGTYIIYGIRANTGVSVTHIASSNMIGGTVANSISLNATGASSQVIGLQTLNAIPTYTSNTIRNMVTNIGTGTTSSASIIGINITSGVTANATLGQNTIFNLSNSNATAASVVTGLHFSGSGTANVVERNFIYGLTVATNSSSAEVNGIRVAAGTTTYRNNFIALGDGISNAIGAAASNSGTTGINGFNGALGTDNFWHNSVLIRGSATAGSGASYAFNGTQTTNTRSFRNNIFYNARNNNGATGSHYAVKINGTAANPTGLTINNNIYLANGSGGVFGYFNGANVTSLSAWRTAVGQDALSFETNPQFVDITSAIPDLHISPSIATLAEGAGVDLGVTNDYDGQTRSGLTPVDIGADAGNFISVSCSSTPSPTDGATAQLQTGVTLSWGVSSTATGYDVYFGTDPAAGTLVSTNQSGTTYSTGTLLASTTYYWKVVPKNSVASASSCSVWSFTTQSAVPTLATTPTSLSFGNQCVNVASTALSFSLNGLNLTGTSVDITAPTNFTVSEDNSTFASTITVNHSSGTFSSKVIYVKFTPTALQAYSDNIVISGGGISSNLNVAVSGTGVNSVSGLSYTSSTVSYCTGNAITANAATLSTTGGTVTYSVSPTLPTGLTISSTTGAISGTPTAASSAANYTVMASNGCSNATATINLEVLTSPTAPASSAGTNAATYSFTANWSAVAGATSYVLDVATNSTFTNIVTGYNALNVGNVTSYSVTGLGSGTSYFYRVRAVNGNCISASSTSQTISTTALTSIATGDWSSGSTWSGGQVPTCADNVTIAIGHTVTVNSASNVSKNLTINSGATLVVSSGDLTVGCTLNNTPLSNNGTLTVNGGALNINGNLLCASSSTFNQSGGEITIDGNGGGIAANSVLTGTNLLRINTNLLNLIGGRITIVDPHAGSSTSDYAVGYSTSSLHYACGIGHTFRFGNGISTDPGGHSNGFYNYLWVSSGYFSFGNVVIDALTGTNRFVKTISTIGIIGDLTVVSGEYQLASTTYIAGNITNGGTLTSTSTLILGTWSNATGSATNNSQTISGSGTFRNLTSSPTASIASLTVNNSSSAGVTISIPLSISGTLTMTAGRINTTSTNIITLGTATAAGTLSYTAGQITGPFARTFAASRTAAGTYDATTLYPVGNGTTYLPIHIDPTTTAGGAVVMSGQVFSTNSGSSGSGVGSPLSSNRWEALALTGSSNLTNCFVGLNDATIASGRIIAQSISASGVYNTISPASTFVSSPSNALRTATAIPAASFTGYFTHAAKAPVITSFTPANGCPNVSSTITITGTDLGSATSVTLNGETCTIVSNTATQIVITTDATPQAGNIVVTNANGTGTSSTSFALFTLPSVSVSFAPSSTICSNGSTIISASGATTFAWSPSTGLSSSTGSNVTANPVSSTNYTVVGTDANGCTSSTTAAVTVNTVVAITGQPATSVVLPNAGTTFSVTATGTGLTYQWQESIDAGTTWVSLTDAGIYSGSTTATLQLTAIPAAANGNQYRCIVSGTAPCPSVTSTTATLVVSSTAIASQPQNQTICSSSGTASFSISTTGDVPTYQWQISTDGGATWSNISGEVSPSLSLSGLTIADNGERYRCALNGGVLFSNSALLTVFDPPSITTQPATITVCSNSPSFDITVAATGSNLTYQWERSTDGGSTWSAITAASSATLTFPSVTTAMDGYQYRVVVSGSAPCASATSSAATLSVTGITAVTPSASSICIGDAVTLTASTTNSTTGLSYSWSSTAGSGAQPAVTGNPAIITPTAAGTYTYTLISTNASCTLTNTVSVTVNALSVGGTATAAATSAFCQSGSTSISLAGHTGSIQWQSSTDNVNFTNIQGATTSSLSTGTISTTTYYRAVLTNGACASVNSTTATVTINNPQVVSTSPGSICASSGSVTLGATANPGATLNWYNASTGGAVIGTGGTFNTPTINTNTTYFVSAAIGYLSGLGATGTPAPTQSSLSAERGIVVSVTQSGTLNSAQFFSASGNYSGTARLLNHSTGTVITTTAISGTATSAGLQTMTLNWPVSAGITYRLLLSLTTGSFSQNNSGVNYSASPWNNFGSAGTILSGYQSGATSSTTYANFYNITFTGCESARTAVVATLNPPPSIAASASSSTICVGQSTTLTATSSNPGYTYSWNNSAGSGVSVSVSPTSTTTYTVTATDNSGGLNNGCTTTANLGITVNPVPSALTITPSTAAICTGQSQSLTATGGTVNQTILSENFDTDAPTWTTTSSAGVAATRFYYQATPFTDASGSATFSNFTTSQGGKFAMGNADAGSSGVTSNTTLVSPVISTVGFTSATLSFEHGFRNYSADVTVAVEISTNGGSSWTSLQSYLGASVGTTTNNAQTTVPASISLASYLGQSNLRIRFNYVSAWGYYWIIDDVKIIGNGQGPIVWSSSPSGLSVTGSATTVSPTAATTYTATATTTLGCTTSASAVVTVNPLPIVTCPANSSVCVSALPFTLNGALPAGGTYSGPGVNSGSFNPATAGVGTHTITYNYTDANSCSNSCSFQITVNPLPVVTSTSGSIACNGGTTSVAVNATGGAAPYTGTGNFTVAAGTYSYTVTDANGCSAQTGISVPQPTALAASSTSGNIACNGGSTAVTVSASGGTAPYTGTGNFTVTAGTYSYTVTDANGCTAQTSITVSQPTTLSASSASGSIACNGGSTAVTVSAGGGTAPYTGTGNFTVTAGTYSYTVTDANGCTTQTNITVSQPTALSASSTSGSIACNGGSTTVSVSATGGTAPYTGTGTFTRSAGTYSFTVTDANGCTSSTTITIGEPTAVSASSTSGSIACNGGSTAVTISAGGGTAPYTGTGNFTVTAGTYSYTVTDANGCTAQTSITVSQPTALSISSTSGSIACNGGSTAVTVSAAGGTAPYTGTGNFTVTAGTYSYTVTDANGCTAQTNITVSQPTALSASSTSGSIACNGGNTTVTISATGGTSPYTGTGNFTVTAGSYDYTVTDANGCQSTTSITVGQPTTLSASSTSGSIACNGGSTTVTVSAIGGTAPYTGTGTFTRTAGTYSFTVTDANGCSSSTTITIGEPMAVSASSTSGSIACNGGSTTVTVTASGGTAPYTGTGNFAVTSGQYSYTVSDANGCQATTSITVGQPTALIASSTSGSIACNGGSTTVTVSATGGTAPYSGTGTFTQTAGTYSFTVTDANGCTSSTTITIGEPTAVSASSTSGSIACNGGSTTVTVTASGGTLPYTGTGNFAVTSGQYSYTVSDANGCQSTTSIIVGEPTALSAGSTSGTISCNGGSTTVTVTASGGTAPYSGTGTFTRTAGTYSFTVTDANGCSAQTSITIGQPTALSASSASGSISCNGGSTTVTVSATGGTAPYTGTGTFNRTAGTYSFTVTDANGCSAQTSITINQPTALAAASTSGSIACTGGSTTVTVSATGGTAPYTGTGTFTRTAGTYSFTVTDANGCTAQTSITIGQPTVLSASSVAGSISCFGGSATVTVSATGGTSPYSGTGNFSRTAGAYSYTVTDANGCTAQTSGSIAQPSLLTASSSSGSIACNGGSTLVNVSASGGVLPYTGIGNKTVTAGPYSFTVTDANGCTAVATGTVSQPAVLSASATAGTITCNGGSANVTVSAQGGTAPYTGTGVNSVVAGNYTYTVTDANGCTASATASVAEPAAISATVNITNTSCPTCSDGAIAVTSVSGGTAPYTYTNRTNLSAGYHCVTITDANGCTYSACGVVNAASCNITASATTGTISCYGGSTTVVVTSSGGTAPITGTGTFTAQAGSSSYVVTDVNGCFASVTVNIPQPTQLSASSSAGSILCNGGSTAVTISASGGTAPYTGTGTVNATAGTHTYTVTDSKGCTAQTSINIAQPSAVQVTATPGIINCNGGNTTVSVTASGGILPYNGTGTVPTVSAGTYTYCVTDGNGCSASATITITQPAVLTSSASGANVTCSGAANGSATVSANGGTLPYSYSWTTGATTASVSALAPGSYSVVVTDARGCISMSDVTITEPSALQASISNQINVSCNGGSNGSVVVNASGGTAPYSGTGLKGSLSAGTYTYTVTDANGCTLAINATITEPSPVSINVAQDSPILCNGDLTTVTVTGSGGTGVLSGTGTFTVPAGTYSYTITDANQCSKTGSITVNQPPALQLSSSITNVQCFGASTGAVDLSVIGGTGSYTYGWTGGSLPAASQDLSGLPAGTYSVVVQDANACTATASYTVTQPLPFPALGAIQGTASACLTYGAGTAVFSVAPISDGVNPTSYIWSPPVGMTILSGQGTPTVTLTWTALAIDNSIAGNVAVTASNGCESRSNQLFVSYATTIPVTPGSVSGPSKLCPGDVATFSITSVSRATHYLWSMPAGMTITGNNQGNIITVSVGGSFTGGNIGVQAANACGTSPVRTRSVVMNNPLTPGVISGAANGLCQVDTNFSILSVAGTNSYLWTLPTGVTIVSGQGTTSIRASFAAFTSGTVSVQSVNACGTSAARTMSIAGAPARPTSITVSGTPCAGGSPVTYTASTSGSATSYTWQSTTGATVLSGQGTKSLNVQWSAGSLGTSQTLTVRASNSCGSSTTRALTFTVPACVREASITTPDLYVEVFPNPLTEGSIIRFENPADSRYSLAVIDLAGRVLQTEQGVLPAGPQMLSLKDVRSLPSGVYLLELNLDGSRNVIRIVVE